MPEDGRDCRTRGEVGLVRRLPAGRPAFLLRGFRWRFRTSVGSGFSANWTVRGKPSWPRLIRIRPSFSTTRRPQSRMAVRRRVERPADGASTPLEFWWSPGRPLDRPHNGAGCQSGAVRKATLSPSASPSRFGYGPASRLRRRAGSSWCAGKRAGRRSRCVCTMPRLVLPCVISRKSRPHAISLRVPSSMPRALAA